jgi:hypothetical protein
LLAGVRARGEAMSGGQKARAERRHQERRRGDRRVAGNRSDVSRIEHENLFNVVSELVTTAGRLTMQLSELNDRLAAVESALRPHSRN